MSDENSANTKDIKIIPLRYRNYEKDEIKKLDDTTKQIDKKYTQFSKKVVTVCLINLFVIEFYAMYIMAKNYDLSSLSYLITAIAGECLACVVWYMKNSETEKKARIQAEIEKLKLETNNTTTQTLNNMENMLSSVDGNNNIADDSNYSYPDIATNDNTINKNFNTENAKG